MREICETYLEDLATRSIHWRRHRSKLRAVTQHLGWVRWAELDQQHGRMLAQRRAAEGRGQGTIAQVLVMLQTACNAWAARYRLVAPKLKLISRPPPLTRYLTEDEAERLIACCLSYHVRMFVMLALHTGARMEAILSLRWGQVDFAKRVVDYGGGPREKARAVVPMNDEIAAALRDAREVRTCDYVIEYGGTRVKEITRSVKAAGARAGIPVEVKPHMLRKTAGSWMLQRGVRMEVVSRVLGHRSIATTERAYAFLRIEDLRPAVDTLRSARLVKPLATFRKA